MSNAVTSIDRLSGALLGMFIGDALAALAMPVHWYYDTEALIAFIPTTLSVLALQGLLKLFKKKNVSSKYKRLWQEISARGETK